MADSTVWWMVAGAAIGIELLSGTFYLLMLAIGLAAGALAAHAGAPLTQQLMLAAIVGAAAVLAWYRVKQKSPSTERASANRDVNMDIGETVHVDAWQGDGSTTVKYRGANWTAVHAAGALPSLGAHRIVEVRGSHLVLEKFDL